MNTMSDQQIATKSKQWAVSFASRLKLARHVVDELAQEAAIGIVRASAKFKATEGEFEPYARLWATALMRRYLNEQCGTVRASREDRDARQPESVSFAREGEEGYHDTRTVEPRGFDEAVFEQALSRVEPAVALMVECKMKGATYEEIAAGMGMSREFVRKRVVAFAEALRVA